MNDKLTLIAAIVVEAFSRTETKNIATNVVRAMLPTCKFSIVQNAVEIEMEDDSEEISIAISISNHEENISVTSNIFYEDWNREDDTRVVVFPVASNAMQFACLQITNQTLDPDFAVEPLYDTRVMNPKPDHSIEDEEVDEDDLDDNHEEGTSQSLIFRAKTFIETWHGTETFEVICSDLGIPMYPKQKTLASLLEFSETNKSKIISDLFDKHCDGDCYGYDFEDIYDLLEMIAQAIDKKSANSIKRKTITEYISDWITK